MVPEIIPRAASLFFIWSYYWPVLADCLPGQAQVKNKIKRVDRLLGNSSLHDDIPLIFKSIIEMLTRQFSLVVIAVDWSGYPSQDYHVLRASHHL